MTQVRGTFPFAYGYAEWYHITPSEEGTDDMTEAKRVGETGAEYRARIETPTEPTIVEALQERADHEKAEGPARAPQRPTQMAHAKPPAKTKAKK